MVQLGGRYGPTERTLRSDWEDVMVQMIPPPRIDANCQRQPILMSPLSTSWSRPGLGPILSCLQQHHYNQKLIYCVTSTLWMMKDSILFRLSFLLWPRGCDSILVVSLPLFVPCGGHHPSKSAPLYPLKLGSVAICMLRSFLRCVIFLLLGHHCTGLPAMKESLNIMKAGTQWCYSTWTLPRNFFFCDASFKTVQEITSKWFSVNPISTPVADKLWQLGCDWNKSFNIYMLQQMCSLGSFYRSIY